MTDPIDHQRRDFIMGRFPATAESARQEHHISSLLVHALPSAADHVAKALETLEGIEIQARDPSGKMILTLETESDAVIVQRLNDIHGIKGVLSAALVFHHFEQTTPRG